MAFGFLLNDDIFISYSRADASDYVIRLDNALTGEKYSCFTDNKGTDAGAELPKSLCDRIRSCKTFVLVGSPGAVENPKNIAREAAEFEAANGNLRIVPISFDRGDHRADWEGADWWEKVQGKTRVRESREALQTGMPSDDAVGKIIERSNYVKNKDRLKRYRNSAFATFILLLAASGVTLGFGRSWLNDARKAKVLAQEAERTAAERIANAQAKVTQAETDAQLKIQEAAGLVVDANKKRESAEKAATSAEKNRLVAEQKRSEAETKKVTAEAEANKQQGIAESRAKASESRQLLRAGPQRILDAVKTAGEAVQQAKDAGATTTESYSALESSLSMLPALRLRRALPLIVVAAFSPDAQSLAAAGPDGNLQLFKTGDLQSKEVVATAPITVKVGERFAISDEAKFVAVADSNNVRIFEPQSDKAVCEFVVKNQYKVARPATTQGEDVIKAIALSPDGRYVAVAANHQTGDEIDAPNETRDFQGVVTLWYVNLETKQGTEIANLGDNYNLLFDIAFGPRGNVLAAGSNGGAILWNLENLKTRISKQAKRTGEESDQVNEGELAAPRQNAKASINEYAGASKVDFELERVWIPQSGSKIRVAPGDDITQFAAISNNDVSIWGRTDGGSYEPSAFLPLSKKVDDFALDLQGDRLTVVSTGGRVSKSTVFEIWDTGDYFATTAIRSRGRYLSILFTDKNTLLANQYGDADEDREDIGIIWPQSEAIRDRDPIQLWAYTNQNGYALAEARYVLAYTEESHYVQSVLEGRKKTKLPKSYESVSGKPMISDDGRLIALLPDTSYGKEVHFFKLKGTSYVQLAPITDLDNKTYYVLSMAKDGSLIAYKNTEGNVILRTPDGPARKLALNVDIASVSELRLSPHGLYLAARQYRKAGTETIRTITVFRTMDGRRMGEMRQQIYEFAFSPDERFLATAGVDKVTNLLDIAPGKVQPFSHLYPVTKVIFSPHSDYFATVSTGGDDCNVYVKNTPSENFITVFDLKTRSKTATLLRKGCIDLLSFSYNGNYLAITGWLVPRTGNSHSVTVWNIRSADLMNEARRRLQCIEEPDVAGAECGRLQPVPK